jgi:RNA polymerase sigma-70 factor, ECF subfamily
MQSVDPDAQLVGRLRRREPGAIEDLVAAFGGRIYRLAISITQDGSDAEEVVQDVLWGASHKIDSFRGAAEFGSWIYRIAANAAYEKRRGRRVEQCKTSWEEVAPTLDEAGRSVHPGVDWSPRLKAPGREGEVQSVLSAAIEELPDEHRTSFLLHDVEGFSNPEIAEALRINPATVKARVHRARLFLRNRLAARMGVA